MEKILTKIDINTWYTSALVPSPLGSLEAASLTSVSIVTYGGRNEINSECSRALLRLVSLLKTPLTKQSVAN